MALTENPQNTERDSFKALLNRPFSLNYILMLKDVVVQRPELIGLAVEFAGEGSTREARTAAWLLSHLSDHEPELLKEDQNRIIEVVLSTPSDSIRRDLLRIIVRLPLPDAYLGLLYGSALKWAVNEKHAIAVRANAMQLLYQICEAENGLAAEVEQHLAAILEYGSSGLMVRGKKIISMLQKLPKT
ncbi:hypothetical protein MASR2M12_19860 [Bacteroidales bacterium]